MNSKSKDRLLGSAALSLLALFAILFGGYLIYEKVYLSILTGHTHERAGIVMRADEFAGFWAWVTTYGLAGAWILITGMFGLVAAVKYLWRGFNG